MVASIRRHPATRTEPHMPMLQRDLHESLRTEGELLHTQIAELARRLDPERLVRRPTPPGWSVGEVLVHLCVVDEAYAKPLATLIHRAHQDAGAPLREWKPSFLGKLMAERLARPASMRTPWWFRPGASPRSGVVEDFLNRHARILRRMEESASLDWRDLRMPLPSLPPLLKLNLGDVFRIHIVHARRHLGQMERVVANTSS